MLLLFVLAPFVIGALVLAPLLSSSVKPLLAAWLKIAPSAGEFATNARAAAGRQATIIDLTDARLEIEDL